MTHTPGPWQYDSLGVVSTTDPANVRVARVDGTEYTSRDDTARLIAAAPDLKEFAECVLMTVSIDENDLHMLQSSLRTLRDFARAAIDKATDGAQLAHKPTYYECGICSAYHSVTWNGDCREDAARFNPEDLNIKHGQFGWEEAAMEDL